MDDNLVTKSWAAQEADPIKCGPEVARARFRHHNARLQMGDRGVKNSVIGFAAATVALLPIAGAAAEELPTLRIAWAEDADALDPTLGRTYVGRIALVDMCASLFTYNDKLAIVPELAAGYEWANSQTLIVKLRSGATFHDGAPVDAAAVKYSLERHATMSGSARKGDVATMDHVEVATRKRCASC